MIRSIILNEVATLADCEYRCHNLLMLSCRNAFPALNITLEAGRVYGFHSDIDGGAWAAVCTIGGRNEEDRYMDGKIFFDGVKQSQKKRAAHSFFWPRYDYTEFHRWNPKKKTTREYVEKALKISGAPYTVEEIKNAFQLTDERFDRPIAYTSGEIRFISLAIAFSLDKDIFCFPWMSKHDIWFIEFIRENGILDFLKSKGKIILIPSFCKDELEKTCDRVYNLDKLRTAKDDEEYNSIKESFK